MTFPFEGSTELPKDDYLFEGWNQVTTDYDPDEFEDADEED